MSNNNNLPLVSVVMATYNEPVNFIRDSINSILNQTYSNIELIIVDDSTKPETIAKIDELASDSRVKLIREVNRIGFVKALNIGLKAAKGKYIARMDGDDISSPDRFSLQVSFLENKPKYSVLGGAMNIVNERGIITSKRTYPSSPIKLLLWKIYRNPIAHPTVMFRRAIVDEGLVYNEEYVKCEDLEFWLRLVKNGYKLYNLPDILLSFRVCEDLIVKRTGEHLIYNNKARFENFSWKSPISSTISIIVSKMYTLLPKRFIKIVYAIENKK